MLMATANETPFCSEADFCDTPATAFSPPTPKSAGAS